QGNERVRFIQKNSRPPDPWGVGRPWRRQAERALALLGFHTGAVFARFTFGLNALDLDGGIVHFGRLGPTTTPAADRGQEEQRQHQYSHDVTAYHASTLSFAASIRGG